VGLTSGVGALMGGGYGEIGCAMLQSGGAECWGGAGGGLVGELGNGTASYGLIPQAASAFGADISFIAQGGGEACTLNRSGRVQCVGENDYGELGDGSLSNAPEFIPVTVLTGGAQAVSAGGFHACAI